MDGINRLLVVVLQPTAGKPAVFDPDVEETSDRGALATNLEMLEIARPADLIAGPNADPVLIVQLIPKRDPEIRRGRIEICAWQILQVDPKFKPAP